MIRVCVCVCVFMYGQATESRWVQFVLIYTCLYFGSHVHVSKGLPNSITKNVNLGWIGKYIT